MLCAKRAGERMPGFAVRCMCALSGYRPRWIGLGIWAGALGLCSCSDDGAGTENQAGADAGSSSSAAALLQCLDLSPERRVSDLSREELESACRAHRSCGALNQFSTEEACRVQSVIASAFAEPPASSEDELRSLCESAYGECLQSPADAIAALEQATTLAQNSPCDAPEQCDASVEQLARCGADLRSQLGTIYPSCEHLTGEFDGKAAPPASCESLGGDCMDLFVVPSGD